MDSQAARPGPRDRPQRSAVTGFDQSPPPPGRHGACDQRVESSLGHSTRSAPRHARAARPGPPCGPRSSGRTHRASAGSPRSPTISRGRRRGSARPARTGRRPGRSPSPGSAGQSGHADIVAVDYEDARRSRPRSASASIPDRPADYLGVADRLNRAAYDVVSLQHEFGIYGGPDGERILDLLDELAVPVVVDPAHRAAPPVGQSPAPDHPRGRRAGVEPAWSCCRTASARTLAVGVRRRSGTDPDHPPRRAGPAVRRSRDGQAASVGLAGPADRAELRAARPGQGLRAGDPGDVDVVEQAPAACYVILGATHPELRRREGEAYRESLQALVADLGLEEPRPLRRRVRRPADPGTLAAGGRCLRHSVSGCRAGRLGHARLRPGHRQGARLDALCLRRGAARRWSRPARAVRRQRGPGREIGRLPDRPPARDEARRRAYAYGRRMTWRHVGASYRELFAEIAADAAGRCRAARDRAGGSTGRARPRGQRPGRSVSATSLAERRPRPRLIATDRGTVGRRAAAA